MKFYLYLAIGGVAGVLLRYLLGAWITGAIAGSSDFPAGTFVINVVGSFLLGFLMRYLTETPASREVRAMMTTGFCGGYTTFSTFTYETFTLLRERRYPIAALYASASFGVSLVACFVGFALAEVALRR